MKKIKNKKIIFILVFIFSIGGTLAYFSSSIDINNVFQSGTYKSVTTEEFISPNDWKPGDVTPKTIVTKNEGDFPVRVRIKLEQQWFDENGVELPLENDGELAAVIDLDNRDDWIYEDEYYYYKYDLMPGETTSSFIKSVTFNRNAVGDFVCTTEDNIEKCSASGKNYQDADYHLNIETSTVQADNYQEVWDINHEPQRVEPTGCVFEGEMVQGAEYVNGQYTYRYMQQYDYFGVDDQDEDIMDWNNIDTVGWGVRLTDLDSTDPVTSDLCTTINDVPVTSYRYMFYNSKTTEVDTTSFDTSNVTDMRGMFYETPTLTSLDVSNFSTENVTNMYVMFFDNGMKSLDVSSFDTSKVTTMGGMFYGSRSTSLNISSFDTENVTNMKSMFYQSRATSLDFSNFDTSNVTNMSGMFYQSRATSLDLSSFDTGEVTDMSYMFYSSYATSIDFSSFDTSNVTTMRSMFYNSRITGFQDFTHFNTSKVTSMYSMFNQSRISSFDVSTWDTSNVTEMYGMFANNTYVTSLDLSNFNTGNVTTMQGMFSSDSNLVEIIGMEDWDTSRVTTFSGMFYYAGKLQRVDLKKWNTQSVSATDAFRSLFYYCTSLTYVDVSNFDTHANKDFSRTFGATHALPSINLTNWDMSNATNMYYFVVNDKSFEELDFSSFKTDKVTNMGYMFHGCSGLKKLYISDLWSTSAVTTSSYMFYNTGKLTGEINNRYTMRARITELGLSDSSTRTIHVGESITIPKVIATYSDESVVQKDSEDLIWKSSDLDVAKANLGVITGVAPGNAVITIKSGIVEYNFNVVIVE